MRKTAERRQRWLLGKLSGARGFRKGFSGDVDFCIAFAEELDFQSILLRYFQLPSATSRAGNWP